jgi:ABC-type phosphate transport system permease subunit
VLFILTLVVNLVARYYVNRAQGAGRRKVPVGMAG